MEKIIFKYLDTNFKIFIGHLFRIYMLDLSNNKMTEKDIYNELMTVFGIDNNILDSIFKKWFNNQDVKLHNAAVDIIYELYGENSWEYKDFDTIIKKLSDRYMTYLTDTDVSDKFEF